MSEEVILLVMNGWASSFLKYHPTNPVRGFDKEDEEENGWEVDGELDGQEILFPLILKHVEEGLKLKYALH